MAANDAPWLLLVCEEITRYGGFTGYYEEKKSNRNHRTTEGWSLEASVFCSILLRF